MDQNMYSLSDANGVWIQAKQAIYDFIQAHGTPGVMPTSTGLRQAGLKDLDQMIHILGGYTVVAAQFGLTMMPIRKSRKPNNYWNDFAHVERELLNFIQLHGTLGIMPTQNELNQAGRSDLNIGVRRHDGAHAVAHRLGLALHSTTKPFGYWQNFDNLTQELLTFVNQHGSLGIMPTTDELTQAGRSDLVGAIANNGGVHVVADRVGLHLSFDKKPHRYWQSFANVECELLAFIEEHGAPGTMPTKTDLQKAGRQDLMKAFRLHHGPLTIADRLKLKLSYSRKSPNYWQDFANVERELLMFIEEHGTSGMMPTREEFRKVARHDLLGAIAKHGGVIKVAEQLHLQPGSTAKPEGYWDDFINIKQELLDFVQEHGVAGKMPTSAQLKKMGRDNLLGAIAKHGKHLAVAELLGLQSDYTAKPAGYWKDFTNVEQELLSFISQFGTAGVMPSRGELIQAGRNDLISAIKKHHGGVFAIAKRLGLHVTMKQNGYWDDFSNLTTELLTFIEHHGIAGYMPTQARLKQANRSDLASAISKHGNVYSVAEQLGLKMENTAKPEGFWSDTENFKHELLTFIECHGTRGVMPNWELLHKEGRGDLVRAIRMYHGMHAVATQLNLRMSHTKKAYRYWQDFENVKRELLALIAMHGTPGVMLSSERLKVLNRGDLMDAIMQHGGITAVAYRLDLIHMGRDHITSTTAVNVERIARALQPLAESNLLSGAQVMIIQRRAGMLDYRNPRITRLNASLAHGHHEEIEQALTQLRNAPKEETIEVLEEEEESLQQEFAETDLETVVESDLPIEPDSPVSSIDAARTAPDLHQEQTAIRGLSALGAIRLPLDEVLSLLTSKILWEAFYKRLYTWYGSLNSTQMVTSDDVQAAILHAYAEQIDNEFVVQAAAKFIREVEQAINLAMKLPNYGWTGPHLRLHQADAARRMADVLSLKEQKSFLLDADDPGMGKSASFLAAIAVSGVRRIVILAPKTVADDTWVDPRGEIRKCLAHASLVRGLRATLDVSSFLVGTVPTFFILHYEELLDDEMVDRLASEQFDCLCIDEVHFVKQRGGQKETYRREALEKIRAGAQSAIGLTGTPLVNELAEPLSLLQLLSRQDPQFAYTRLNNRRMGDIADVFEGILPHIVRRRKKDVLLHLPVCDVHPVDIALHDDLLERIRTIGMWPKARASHAIVELRKVALEAKLPTIRKRAASAKKLLVLTYLRDEVSEDIYADLHEFFPGQVGQINGTIPKEQRKEILDAFRASDGLRILVGTIGTIGVGLTLFDPIHEDTAHEIIVADLPYTAAEFDQGIARLHREGQKHRVVVDVLLTTTHVVLHDGSSLRTIDQRIWDLILGKRELSDVAIDGQYVITDAATKVRKALHSWLKQIRETGVEPLVAEQRSAELSQAQKWRGEIARLRGMSAAKADTLFTSAEYTHAFLNHLRTSPASHLAYQWLRAKLASLLRPDLHIVDMGCGLNPFADLPCHVTGLDRHGLPGQIKGKMEHPPLPDASADVLIYSLSLYGTTDDLRAYFTQARRILRGGGHLLIVEPGSSFTTEGLLLFISDLQQFGFEQVGNMREIRGEDGIVLKGMHFTLTGEVRKPEDTSFEKK